MKSANIKQTKKYKVSEEFFDFSAFMNDFKSNSDISNREVIYDSIWEDLIHDEWVGYAVSKNQLVVMNWFNFRATALRNVSEEFERLWELESNGFDFIGINY